MTYTDDHKREYDRKWIAARRAAWFAGKSCVNCGSTERLEADHIDPSTKKWNPRDVWSRKEADRLAELAKCQVLCKPCHWAKTTSERAARAAHGTRSMYTYSKCRCEPCRAANSEYNRSRRKERKS